MDCMDGMAQFPDKFFDLCITDPPYGIGLEYGCFDDTKDNLKAFIDKFMPEILRVSKRALITCGNANMHLYPKPNWTLAWVSDAGVGSGPWGFSCWQPILAYGKDPFSASGKGRRPDIFVSNEPSDKTVTFHPCPKPLKTWKKILLRGSVLPTDKILDPFTGSGTSAIACHQLQRQFWGFELDPDYFKAATERLNKVKAQVSMTELIEQVIPEQVAQVSMTELIEQVIPEQVTIGGEHEH